MIGLAWSNFDAAGDLARTATGRLADDDTLATAVLLSLLLDRRARTDDALPDPAGDRRGWVGDALSPRAGGDRIGSRLWLLARAKQTEETRRRADAYAREALAWLLEDRLADRVAVTVAWNAPGLLGIGVSIDRAGDVFETTVGVPL